MTDIETTIEQLDIKYSYNIAKHLEKEKTNPRLGFRSAGSDAEIKTGLYIEEEMKSIGLKQVKRDKIKLDSWVFEKARMSFKSKSGKVIRCELGAYQTEFHTDGVEEYGVAYLKKGLATDYDGIDVKGKLVIVDINQREEWWINYPVYEAYLHGAAAVLAVQQYGYGEIDDTALNAQDIAGPAEAAAFSMSKKDADRLKKALKKDPDMKVKFSAESTVCKDQSSYNIVGRIPGRCKDSYIMLSAHYDSYFKGFQDDNTAIGMMLGMARAIIKSGYKPLHTILIVAMCAEEWGVIDSKYDWSTGAFEEMFTVHPEWQGKIISSLNFELPALSHGPDDAIRSTYEYRDFLKDFITNIKPPKKIYPKGLKVKSPIQTWSDDFSISISGTPSHVNEFASGEYMSSNYHSQYDSESFYNKDVYRFHHELYTRLLFAYDKLLLPPMNFVPVWNAMEHAIDDKHFKLSGIDVAAFRDKLDTMKEYSKELYSRIMLINDRYAELMDAGDDVRCEEMRNYYASCRKTLLDAFKKEQFYFVRLTWNDDVVLPHEAMRDNLLAVEKVIEALKADDSILALKKVYEIDNNKYAFLFSKKVFNHFTSYIIKAKSDRLKWGAGRIVHHVNLFDSVTRLKNMATMQIGCTRVPDTMIRKELKFYKALKKELLEVLSDDVTYMDHGIDKIYKLLQKAQKKMD